MSNLNNDKVDLALKIGSLIIQGATTIRKIDKTNRAARQAGRATPIDQIKNWFF